jgi:hypothetical protein
MIDPIADSEPIILSGYNLNFGLAITFNSNPFHEVLLQRFWLN